MSNLKVFWWKLDKGHGNFGDELNPYIIEKLSKQNVEHVQINFVKNSILETLVSVAKKIKRKKYKLKNFFNYKEWKYISTNSKVIVGIGSVISVYKYDKTIVWGAGIIKRDANIHPADFRAVRGKYTQERMNELGLTPPNVVGDPALLLPIIYNPETTKKYKLAIIPHYKHFEKINEANTSKDIKIINLLDSIETIISQIKASEITLSTSLHGVIVSHAYNIPSLWIKFNESQNSIGGDDIKFKDYFSSVNLSEYEALDGKNFSERSLEDLLEQINSQPKDQLLANQTSIKHIQENLIRVAPFKVLEEYKNF